MGKNILPWLNQKTPVQVGVIGDLILDEYLEGIVNRISPEAPVPIHLVSNSLHRAGGAANAAMNVKLVGADVVLFGVLGDDSAGSDLIDILKHNNIDTKFIIKTSDRPTIKKTRISASRQQLVRIDWEKLHPIFPVFQEQIINNIKSQKLNSILLSDYGKGALPESLVGQIISWANLKNIPVVIDPKGDDYSRYKDCYLITPNKSEACKALGRDPLKKYDYAELAYDLQQKYGLRNILITLGAEGMYLYPEDSSKAPIYLRAQSREVFDVSGAGDTVAAIMGLSLGAGLEFHEAMHIANTASGKVVERWGTRPIEQKELEEALSILPTVNPNSIGSVYSTAVKIKTLKELLERIKLYREEHPEAKIVFTNGCFDILHSGHISYLEEARSKGDILIIGVNSDISVKNIKGPSRPVVPIQQRMRVLAALSCVTYVTSFDEDTPENLIKSLLPDILIKGADWPKEKIIGADIVEKNGGTVENIDLIKGVSTTNIINKIKEL